MTDSHIESLYQEAKSAIKARDYEYAIELLKRVLVIDENYKDTSRLLEKAIRLRKLRWYKNPRLWGALGLVVVFVLGIVIAPKIGNLFTSPDPTNTIGPSLTNTAMQVSTSTATPTRTPRPTPTVTPLPAWVTDFSEPLLAEISKHPPTIQDDFNDNSGGWVQAPYCDRFSEMKLADGELNFVCTAERTKMAYIDFVLEFDTRFLQGSPDNSTFSIYYRKNYSFQIQIDGSLTLNWFTDPPIHIPGKAQTNQSTNHILIIAKGNRYAFYINNNPIYYVEDTHYFTREAISFWASPGPLNKTYYAKVALDNLEIWDLEKIPNLP